MEGISQNYCDSYNTCAARIAFSIDQAKRHKILGVLCVSNVFDNYTNWHIGAWCCQSTISMFKNN